MKNTKRIRMLVVLSAICFALVVLVAIHEANGFRSFDFAHFFFVLTAGAILPLVVWGIAWILSAPKQQAEGKQKPEPANKTDTGDA